MKIIILELQTELQKINEENSQFISSLIKEEWESVSFRPAMNKWNCLEVAQHLNLYFQFYLPAIKENLIQRRTLNKQFYRTGIVGNYFANLMKPENTGKGMKTMKDKDPIHSPLTAEVLLELQNHFIDFGLMLQQLSNFDLDQTKVAISITNLLKLKLGDVLRFLSYHNQRHIYQMKNLIASIHHKELKH